MKKTLAVMLMVALLIAILPTAALAASQTKVYRVKTNGGTLFVHSAANDKKSTRIGSLRNGAALTVLKTSGNWYRVKTFAGQTGWVAKKYVAAGAMAKVVTPSKGLNIRSIINGRPILGSAPKGAQVTVQYISGNWAKVLYKKLNGWAYRPYLKWTV